MRIDALTGDTLHGVLTGGSPCAIKLSDVRRILNQTPPSAPPPANPAAGAGPVEIRMGITIQPR
jgi:hypothetical protein